MSVKQMSRGDLLITDGLKGHADLTHALRILFWCYRWPGAWTARWRDRKGGLGHFSVKNTAVANVRGGGGDG